MTIIHPADDDFNSGRRRSAHCIAGFEEIVLEQLAEAEKVRIGKLVQLTVRLKPATKARKGRNPATGDEITIAAKPYSASTFARGRSKAPRRPCRLSRRLAASSPPDAAK